MPQVFLPDIRAAMAKGDVKVNALVDDDREQSGTIAFIENTVDSLTGTVTAKARIPNANEGLWPGQFVKVEVVLGIEPEAIAVPAAGRPARAEGPLRVRRQGQRRRAAAHRHQAHAGRRIGHRQGARRGRAGGVDGQLRLVNGANVVVRPGTPEPRRQPPRRRAANLARRRVDDRSCSQRSAFADRS